MLSSLKPNTLFIEIANGFLSDKSGLIKDNFLSNFSDILYLQEKTLCEVFTTL